MIHTGLSKPVSEDKAPCGPAKETAAGGPLHGNGAALYTVSVERGKKVCRSAPIKVALAASLAALGCLRPPSWNWAVGPIDLNDVLAATHGDSLSLRPAGVTIAAHQMRPVLLPSFALDKVAGLENWRTHEQFKTLLKKLNIRVTEQLDNVPGYTTSDAHATSFRHGAYVNRLFLSGGAPKNESHRRPSHTGLALGVVKRRPTPPLRDNASEPARATSTAIDLSVRRSPPKLNSSNTEHLQKAFETLQSMIQSANPRLAGAASLTDIEREQLVACCHIRCFIPGILRSIQASGSQRTPISILAKLQDTLSQFRKFQQQWPFANGETEVALQHDQRFSGADSVPLKGQSYLNCCLDLISRSIGNSQKFLTELEKQKGTLEKNFIQRLARRAVNGCRDNYNHSFSSLGVQSDCFQLYSLLDSVLRWAPVHMQGGRLCTEAPLVLQGAGGSGHHFIANDTVDGICERIMDVQQCTAILQTLRFHWNAAPLADNLEAEFVRGAEQQFFSFNNAYQPLTSEERNEDRLRESIMQQIVTDICRSHYYLDSEFFKKQGEDYLINQFRAISKMFKLGFKRFLVDKSLCDSLSPAFLMSTNRKLQEAGQRLVLYSKEAELACKFINKRIKQFIAENRRPDHADVLDGIIFSGHRQQQNRNPSRSVSLQDVEKQKANTGVSGIPHGSTSMVAGNATLTRGLDDRCLTTEPSHTAPSKRREDWIPIFVTGYNTSGVTDLKGSTVTPIRKKPQAGDPASTRNPAKTGHLGAHPTTTEASRTSTTKTKEPLIPIFVAEMNAADSSGSGGSSMINAKQTSKVESFAGRGKAVLPARFGASCATPEASKRSTVGAIANPMPTLVTDSQRPSTTLQTKSGVPRFNRLGETSGASTSKRNRHGQSVKALLRNMLIRKQRRNTGRGYTLKARSINWLQKEEPKRGFKMQPISPQSGRPLSRVQSDTALCSSEPSTSTGTAIDLSLKPNVNLSSRQPPSAASRLDPTF